MCNLLAAISHSDQECDLRIETACNANCDFVAPVFFFSAEKTRNAIKIMANVNKHLSGREASGKNGCNFSHKPARFWRANGLPSQDPLF
jgi:hypothetical protein